MSEQPKEMIEKPDCAQTDSTRPLSPKGREAMQGELQAYQDDLEKHEEQLFKHKARMQENRNQQAVDETEAEIRKTDNLLFETVQKKHGIKPDQDESTKEYEVMDAH